MSASNKKTTENLSLVWIELAIMLATSVCTALFFLALFAGGDADFIATPYIFDLMVLFLYTFPCYLALIELGLSVCRAFEKRKRSVGEKIFNTIGAVLACGILITLTNLEDLLFVSLALAGALALNWLITAIVYKKKPNLKT